MRDSTSNQLAPVTLKIVPAVMKRSGLTRGHNIRHTNTLDALRHPSIFYVPLHQGLISCFKFQRLVFIFISRDAQWLMIDILAEH